MKKLITILCTGLITIGLSAQTDQGTMYLGVSGPMGSGISYTSTSYDGIDDALSQLNLNVNGGYFVIDNLMVGALLGISTMKWGDSDGGNTTFGIVARYYINGIFPMVSYASSKEKDADDAMSALSFGAGYAVMLNDNVAFEPSITYGMVSYDGENVANVLGINFGFGIHF
jgi:hypothetical protein